MSIENLYIKPDIDKKSARVSFTAPSGSSKVEWSVKCESGIVASGEEKIGQGDVSFETGIPDCRLWSVDAPFLYTLVLKIHSGGDVQEERSDFGMYKIRVSGNRVYFNDRILYIKGVIRGRKAHDHPNLLGLDEEEFYARYIRRAKEYGFNFIRFHSTIPPETYFKAANRLGMLTHVEIRPYFGKYQKERAAMDAKKELVKEDEWRSAILRLRNHPSVLVYCLGNEINSPGRNPEVAKLYGIKKELDTERLFLDTCSRGEFDRENVDIDVQHMSYFAPFGRNYRMFETPEHTNIYGSCKGLEMETGEPEARTVRHIKRKWPLLAHEICHYAALRDIDSLDAGFENYKAEKPWWIDELKKLRSVKGLTKHYNKLLEASKRYQFIWWKQCIESVRRSPILQGFHMLQLSDTDRYENSNGLLDPFDEPRMVDPEKFLSFNADAVLAADMPRRCFSSKEFVDIPVWFSHYDRLIRGEAALEWTLEERNSDRELSSGRMDRFSMEEQGLRKLCTIKAVMPASERPMALELGICLKTDKAGEIKNSWNIWVFPGEGKPVNPFSSEVKSFNLGAYYPCGGERGGKLLAAENFSEKVFEHLQSGGDVLMLYRAEENRNKKSPGERYYMPSTRDRFKAVIWDRGHNCGAFMRESPLWKNFPNDGFVDFSFANLIDDSDKIDLSDFPAAVEPLMEGVDKAVRDRYDVHKFRLSELQPGWTMRRFAYIFEIRAGEGRLLVCGFNFKGTGKEKMPEVRAMLEALIAYAQSEEFRPEAFISVEDLKQYLEKKGESPRIKERMMTQFWQLDDAPLESAEFWKNAEAYLREDEAENK